MAIKSKANQKYLAPFNDGGFKGVKAHSDTPFYFHKEENVDGKRSYCYFEGEVKHYFDFVTHETHKYDTPQDWEKVTCVEPIALKPDEEVVYFINDRDEAALNYVQSDIEQNLKQCQKETDLALESAVDNIKSSICEKIGERKEEFEAQLKDKKNVLEQYKKLIDALNDIQNKRVL